MNISRILLCTLAMTAFTELYSQDTVKVEKPDFTQTIEVAPGIRRECDCYRAGGKEKQFDMTQEGFDLIDSCMVFLRQKYPVKSEDKSARTEGGKSRMGGMSVQEFEKEEILIAKYTRVDKDWMMTEYSFSEDVISTGRAHKKVNAVESREYETIYREKMDGKIYPEVIGIWYFPMSKY